MRRNIIIKALVLGLWDVRFSAIGFAADVQMDMAKVLQILLQK